MDICRYLHVDYVATHLIAAVLLSKLLNKDDYLMFGHKSSALDK